MMRGFEGGQMPLHRRLPSAASPIFPREYQVVNLTAWWNGREKHTPNFDQERRST